ncbi:DUF438 domain-containing protein [Thermophagus sp. OGC60D27]|uniref:DUF438 domain-containing protein n=1 Tax=Thermophagus sp. OGC60D27 TaxID=3458415 RepID=UPI004038272D
MSELLNNSFYRKEKLKALILRLHQGDNPHQVRADLIQTLKSIPYGEVVEVEQELIEEGLPVEEVLQLCDVHSEVLEGHVDLSAAKEIPPGHPVDTFIKENRELTKTCNQAREVFDQIRREGQTNFQKNLLSLKQIFNNLMDVDKHYQRKEYLIFPFLEQKGITGPPKVMWGKHDEAREQLKGAIEILNTEGLTPEDLLTSYDMLIAAALSSITDMVTKEEEILLPMALDQLTDAEWWQVYQQTLEIGYCLVDPQTEWKPETSLATAEEDAITNINGRIQMPSGSLSLQELIQIFNTLPVDITFVDKDDKVKYFSQSPHRIFTRSRAIINRDVRYCHPPASVHIVDKILDDFRSGRQSHAPFWIQMRGRFIYIQYFALRDDNGQYLGTLEVSQDLTELRKLEGEQRILNYQS